MRTLLVAGGLLTAVAALAVEASAAPLGEADLRARAAGGEFRGNGTTRRSQLEDVIWRFRADGTMTSLSQVVRHHGGPAGGSETFEEYRDAGAWRIDGGRLCVELRSAHRDLTGCYTVDAGAGSQVTLAGPVQLRGTLGH